MQVLVVDDDPDILALLSLTLETMGSYNVTTAQSGSQALEAVRAASVPFDIFLLDIQMPGMSGIDLCAALRLTNEHRNAPIIMLTAMAEKKYVDLAFAAGASDYVTKPFDPLELRHRIGIAERAVHKERHLAEFPETPPHEDPGVSAPNYYPLSEPIQIDDVNGVMRLEAFENYLRQLNRLQFSKTQLVVVSVTNINDIYDRCAGEEFANQVTDISEGISDGLSACSPFIAYFGAGVFSIALGAKDCTCLKEMKFKIDKALLDLGMCFANGDPVPVKLDLAEVVMPSLFAPGAVPRFIDQFFSQLKLHYGHAQQIS